MELAYAKGDLEAMSYAELRKVAKSVGIKANMKTSKLLKALQDYFDAQQKDAGLPLRAKTKGEGDKETGRKSQVNSPAPSLTSVKKSSSLGPSTPLSAARRIRTPSSAKARPSLHRLRTPPSRKSSPAVRASLSGRKRARSPEGGATPAGKRTKSHNEDRAEVEEEVSSPGTKQIIDSVDDTLTEGEMKEKIMDALNKKVQDKMDGQPSNIPRFVAFAEKKKQEAAATVTPGQQRWQKVHAKHFNMMDSIDTYLEKKKKRVEIVSGSAQKSGGPGRAAKKPKTGLTPSTESKVGSKASTALFKTPVEKSKKFVPQVTSMSKVNFNFTTTKTTPGAGSATKRKSPRLLQANTSENIKLQPKTTGGRKGMTPGQGTTLKPSNTETKPKAHTPYKFNATLNQSYGANTSINKSMKKPKFDLAASLARPLSWKPHTGKLMPIVPENPTAHKKDIKAVKVTTKEERRQKAKAAQSKRRHSNQMKRRGIQA